MNILIAVHNLTVEKCHLMPWRTVCEVVYHMQQDGHQAHLVSLSGGRGELRGRLIPEGTKAIRKNPGVLVEDLEAEVERTRPDVIFWPVAWREPPPRIKIATGLNVQVALWFPGGVYSLAACLHALKVIGFANTLPYLRETLSSRKKQVFNFKKCGVRAILAMTEATARSAVEVGWPSQQTFVIPPGKENNLQVKKTIQTPPAEFQQWLADKPFYLFMGPPSGIRGIFDLLPAFDLAAAQNKEIRLVCLFRSDGELDSRKVKNAIEKCKYKDRIYSVWQSLTPEQLNGYMAACHAVAMPFVLVPSEIPLAIIEAMAWGKPIITTTPGGTGEFVEEFGLSPKVGDNKALADSMVKLHQDQELYEDKCRKTVDAYSSHPDWRAVALQWADVAQHAVQQQ